MASCADMKAPENLLQSERGKVPLNHRPGASKGAFPLILRKKSQGVSCDPANSMKKPLNLDRLLRRSLVTIAIAGLAAGAMARLTGYNTLAEHVGLRRPSP